ncbi:MAG: sensor histidine kinase [Tyzzerella sp.]|nr:sensor histidine kinase [Tyzzerella sp.]
MDTKLKKSHKLTTIIIILCILVPAFLLTALYPRIGVEAQKTKKEYEDMYNSDDEFSWWLEEIFINYAMETSYYLYGLSLQEAHGETVDFRVLEQYGWINDFWRLSETTKYQSVYQYGEKTIEKKNTDQLEDAETIGTVRLAFDSHGYLSEVYVDPMLNVELYDANSVAEQARKSIEQYVQNIAIYEAEFGPEIDPQQMQPKNFTITFAINEYCGFLYYDSGHLYISAETIMFEIGAIWIIIAAIILVALFALLLPFVKGLHTGWEKLFCIPFEMVVICASGVVAGFVGMFYAMGETCLIDWYPPLEVVGVPIVDNVQYGFLLAMNFLGWAACFLVEYVVIASFRQFLCGPVYYLKNRLLIVIFFRWIKKQCVKLYKYVTDIDISEELNSSILKIVAVNFGILALLCVMWFFGIAGLLVYSIALYIVLRKYGKKVQAQYNSILNATKQMAEGDLKIKLEEDLGIFQTIGDSLEKVQQGFEKAVVEEAKSQNMKTELITNVSHDLKTPLTAIITYVDLLKQEGITEEERNSYIRTLEQKSHRLKILIEDLFEVSKAHSGNVKMNFMDVDIVSLMKQVRLEMSDQIDASNLTFRWNLPDEKIVVPLDGQRTYRVFENLLNNALKYAMPYSRVYVDIFQTESKVHVVFRNMSAQELDFEAEHLAERFVRGDASRNSEGSGLGLAIAKSFVELQRGEFKIEVDGDLFKVKLTWNK